MISTSGLNYEIVGSQSEKKLVFLHGLLGSLNNWRSIAKHFSSDFQILLIDQRGHGKSFHPSSGYRPEDYAEDLNSLLEELAWSKIHLVGHSMGGRNALVFATLFPTKINSLVIEDISVGIRAENVNRIQAMLERVPVPFASREAAKDYFLGPFVESLQGSSQALSLAQYLLSNIIERKERGDYSWRFSLDGVFESLETGRRRDFWSEWERITQPTLLIRGEHSSDLNQKEYEQMLLKSPVAQGVIIARAGHWVHFDAPDEFVAVLRSFYDSLTSSLEVV